MARNTLDLLEWWDVYVSPFSHGFPYGLEVPNVPVVVLAPLGHFEAGERVVEYERDSHRDEGR